MLTTRYVTGAPSWIEVATPDTDEAAAFYGGVLGWRLRPAPDGEYAFFELDGETVAGCARTAPEQGPPSWTVYLRTPDAEATAEAAARARGRVLVPPTRVGEQGVAAVLADRTGAAYGVWQPGRREGLDRAGGTGALCWAELYTPDVAAAAAHYDAVLGLETSAVSFPDGTYTALGPAGADEGAVFGGVVPLADDPLETEPHWLPYIAVADPDAVVAAVRGLGGAVRLPATDVEGVGRVARLADPYGARFAVLRPAPREV
ncbi:VOC family protein [Streptomyces sp. CRN 30]|uniref:VOC family protein n=1 Tax=Streptomyces sp. CRN 30 TaxID=3075613 RepID=UPI002A8132F3|nr:VOC family protein [Streptomyces sp. CRN 30]